MGALTKIFGTHSERELKRIYPLVDKVESYRDSMQKPFAGSICNGS